MLKQNETKTRTELENFLSNPKNFIKIKNMNTTKTELKILKESVIHSAENSVKTNFCNSTAKEIVSLFLTISNMDKVFTIESEGMEIDLNFLFNENEMNDFKIFMKDLKVITMYQLNKRIEPLNKALKNTYKLMLEGDKKNAQENFEKIFGVSLADSDYKALESRLTKGNKEYNGTIITFNQFKQNLLWLASSYIVSREDLSIKVFNGILNQALKNIVWINQKSFDNIFYYGINERTELDMLGRKLIKDYDKVYNEKDDTYNYNTIVRKLKSCYKKEFITLPNSLLQYQEYIYLKEKQKEELKEENK